MRAGALGLRILLGRAIYLLDRRSRMLRLQQIELQGMQIVLSNIQVVTVKEE